MHFATNISDIGCLAPCDMNFKLLTYHMHYALFTHATCIKKLRM